MAIDAVAGVAFALPQADNAADRVAVERESAALDVDGGRGQRAGEVRRAVRLDISPPARRGAGLRRALSHTGDLTVRQRLVGDGELIHAAAEQIWRVEIAAEDKRRIRN